MLLSSPMLYLYLVFTFVKSVSIFSRLLLVLSEFRVWLFSRILFRFVVFLSRWFVFDACSTVLSVLRKKQHRTLA